jgi:hypothetical protein
MPESYSEAAVRHLADSDELAAVDSYDGAGHLIGFSVECAIKHAVASLRPDAKMPRFHLPEIVDQAKKALQGRSKFTILTVLARPGFMDGWKIDYRYFPDNTVDRAQYERWRDDAARTLGAAGLRRKKLEKNRI